MQKINFVKHENSSESYDLQSDTGKIHIYQSWHETTKTFCVDFKGEKGSVYQRSTVSYEDAIEKCWDKYNSNVLTSYSPLYFQDYFNNIKNK